MRLVQALRKLGKVQVTGFDVTDKTWDIVLTRALLESSQRWISERVGFNARRVLLTTATLDPYRVIKISDDDVQHILYSEQRNVRGKAAFLYDYTLLDKTNEMQVVTFTTTPSASGMETSVVETLSDPFPVHLVRYAKADSNEVDSLDYTRSYCFAPGDIPVDPDNELLSSTGDRYLIEEAEPELLTTRLMLVKR